MRKNNFYNSPKLFLPYQCLHFCCLLFGFSSFFISDLSAQTYIKTTATGTGSGASWDNALGASSLESAVEAGGTVYIAEGTYNITAELDLGNDVSIIGGYPAAATGTDLSGYSPAAYPTILDRGASGKIFDETGADNILIRGLVLQNASGSAGSAFEGTSGTAAIDWQFEDLVVQNNNTTGDAALYFHTVTGSSAKISVRNSYFTGNTGINGTCITASTVYNGSSGADPNLGNFIIDGCSFHANNASGTGGALNFTTSHAWNITNSCFSNNVAGSDGGAIYFTTSGANIINGCTFSNNTGGDDGGALSFSTSKADILNSDFINNTCLATNDQGGAIFLTTSSAIMTNCGFYGNTAGDGGAVYSTTWYSTGGSVRSRAENCTFYNNSCAGTGTNTGTHGGGAVCITANANAWDFVNSTFSNNAVTNGSSWGGAISHYDASSTIDGCTFFGNTLGGSSTVDGADVKNYNDAGELDPIANSAMQLASAGAYVNQAGGTDAASYNFTTGNTFSNTTDPSISAPAAVTCGSPIIVDNDGDGVADDGTDTDVNDPCVPAQSPGYVGYDANNAIWQADDCDGDGVTNGQETGFGTDPYDATSLPTLGDNDNDNVPDINDEDDDNDGILDTDENNCTVLDPILDNNTTNPAGTYSQLDITTEEGQVFNWASVPNFDIGVTGDGRNVQYLNSTSALNTTAGNATQFDVTVTFPTPSTTFQILAYDFDGLTQEYIENFSVLPTTLSANAVNTTGTITSTSGNQDIILTWNLATPISSLTFRVGKNNTGQGITFDVGFPFCDADGDGTPNSLDLDSDNDGCSDANEYYVDPNADGGDDEVYGTGTPTVDTNNGQIVGAPYSGGNYSYATSATINACMDADSDMVPDAVDNDDDNDGILDTEEMECATYNQFNGGNIGTIGTYTITGNFTGPSDITYAGSGQSGSYLLSSSPNAPLGLIDIDFDTLMYDVQLTATDLDGSENFNLRVYDASGTLIEDVTSYVTHQGSDIAALTDGGAGQSLFVTGGPDTERASTSVLAAIVLDFPYEVSRVEIERLSGGNGSGGVLWGVTNACEWLDSDNDGTPNHLDLDADNDGCSDANEYYNSTTADGGDTGVFGIDPATVNSVTGQVTAASYTGTYTNVTNNAVFVCPADTDGDGVADSAETSGEENDPCLPAQSAGYVSYNAANAIWQAGDCDGDGINNTTEITNPTVSDPYDPCDPDANNLACPTGDYDGDGVANITDTDPSDPCIPMQNEGYVAYNSTNLIWRAGNCDGDLDNNGAEADAGSDPYCDQSTVANTAGSCTCAAGAVAPIIIKN